jgi:hypothetical protein
VKKLGIKFPQLFCIPGVEGNRAVGFVGNVEQPEGSCGPYASSGAATSLSCGRADPRFSGAQMSRADLHG